MPQPLIDGEQPEDFKYWDFTTMRVDKKMIFLNASYLNENSNYYGNEKIRLYFKLN